MSCSDRRLSPGFIAIILLNLVFGASAFAIDASYYVAIDQPSPDSRTFITATIRPARSCGVLPPTVTVSGNKVTIKAEYQENVVCIATWVPMAITARIGTLKGGVYDVVGTAMNWDGDVHVKLVVRDIDPLRVFPSGGTIAGGTKIRIIHDGSVENGGPLTITFDGVPATDVQRGATRMFCTAPPHAAGDVDVAVTFSSPDSGSTDSKTYTMRAAYRYFDPSAPPDPFLTERLLFPLKYESVGAYGSQWTTDSTIAVPRWSTPGFADFWYPPCPTCSTRIEESETDTFVRLEKGNNAAGALLYVVRGTGDALVSASRIHDVSRQAESAGTDVPIVHENDFRTTVKLYNVPLDSRYRALLRVWSLSSAVFTTDASFRIGTGYEVVPLRFTAATTDSLAFASADLTPVLQKYPAGTIGNLTISTYDKPLWAMISLTNNTTEEVTIIAPH